MTLNGFVILPICVEICRQFIGSSAVVLITFSTMTLCSLGQHWQPIMSASSVSHLASVRWQKPYWTYKNLGPDLQTILQFVIRLSSKFIVRSNCDSDLRRAKICLVSWFETKAATKTSDVYVICSFWSLFVIVSVCKWCCAVDVCIKLGQGVCSRDNSSDRPMCQCNFRNHRRLSEWTGQSAVKSQWSVREQL